MPVQGSTQSMSTSRKALVIFLTCALLHAIWWPTVSVADEASDEPSTEESVGVRMGAYALTPLYFVAKVAYAGAGAVIGGLTWALSAGNTTAARAVWDASLRGDYWITPSHLTGDSPVRFIGTTEKRPVADQSSPLEPKETPHPPGTQDREKSQTQGAPKP